jgi:hypothetical protein
MNQKYTSEVKEELKMLAPVLSGLPKANITNCRKDTLKMWKKKS